MRKSRRATSCPVGIMRSATANRRGQRSLRKANRAILRDGRAVRRISPPFWRRRSTKTVTIKESGSRRTISKREAMVKQLANKAASGDNKSIQLLVAYLQRAEAQPDAPEASDTDFDSAEEAVIEGIVERLRLPAETDNLIQEDIDKNEP
jgi:uncharacterized protein DUF5681